jgi:hypothetical protein
MTILSPAGQFSSMDKSPTETATSRSQSRQDSARVHTKKGSKENQPPQQIRNIKNIQGTAIKKKQASENDVTKKQQKERTENTK